jgi:hypothetical protein
MMVVRLSFLCTSRLYTPGNIPPYSFLNCNKHHFLIILYRLVSYYYQYYTTAVSHIVTIILFISRRQPGVVALLYSGIQCSSCGVRFPPEQTMKYSQHLDWHFRQNRRDRDNTRKAQSRKWYYDVSDWIQFEEIEDLEERGTVFFTYLVGLFEDEMNICRSWDEIGLPRSA